MAAEKQFDQNRLYEVKDGQRYWIGVESWTITDGQGTKTTNPALVKRDKSQNKTGEARLGKAKGFTLEDLEEIERHMDRIKEQLRL